MIEFMFTAPNCREITLNKLIVNESSTQMINENTENPQMKQVEGKHKKIKKESHAEETRFN